MEKEGALQHAAGELQSIQEMSSAVLQLLGHSWSLRNTALNDMPSAQADLVGKIQPETAFQLVFQILTAPHG